MGELMIGTSGFSFDDWIGEVYPAGIKKHEMLPYYEGTLGFKTLEVNYTYYALPSRRTMESFVAKTSHEFSFAVKAYKGITHERDGIPREQFRQFKEGLRPLGKRLHAVLFQFPYTFLPLGDTIAYLKILKEEFDDLPLVVEFRNVKWFREEYLQILRDLSMGFCIVDEPKLKGLLPFTPVLTSDMGYFRLHGRNTRWFREPVDVRYDYLYTEKELNEFVSPIEDIAARASTTFVFFNNCHAGKAVKNAHMLKEILEARVERSKATSE
jgi:uncharacterized protein YecE (DUF72 family)